MNRSTALLLLIALFVTVTLASGCEENQQFSDKRAMLVGHENIQLKKQIKQKDKEIAQLKAEVAKVKEESEKAIEQSSKAATDIMGIMSETMQKAAQLEMENAKFKAELEKLK
jgi:hypothetical protein